jgi:allophanate hydrolase subunit 1
MPRLTFNRKDMAGQSIGIATAMTGISSADSIRAFSGPI